MVERLLLTLVRNDNIQVYYAVKDVGLRIFLYFELLTAIIKLFSYFRLIARALPGIKVITRYYGMIKAMSSHVMLIKGWELPCN